MKIVSLTLARGGSKGVKRKNLALINGRPLVSYVVETANNSNVEETWVSTEDSEIAEVAASYGAKIMERPPEMATDVSKCEESLLHFAQNVDFDVLVFIQATSPLVEPEDINRGIELIKTGQYDSVFSVTREHWVPRWTSDLKPVDWDPFCRPRRQEKEVSYIENGAFYITTSEFLLKNKNRYGGIMGFVELPLARSFQVDSQEEIDLIGKLLR
jgi:N-acylneuraminate cytidylyltransferase